MTSTPTTPNLDLANLAKTTLVQQIGQANDLARQILAATADTGNLVSDIRNDPATEDETVKAFQEWLEKINAAVESKTAEIDEHIKANLMPSRENVDVPALTEQFNGLRKIIRDGITWIDSLGADTSDMPALKSLRGGTSSTSAGDTRRPRVNDILVNGESVAQDVKNAKTGKVERKANFTYAANVISKASGAKVNVSDLQSAAFAAAKTDDLKTLNGEAFDFYFESGEGDKRQNFNVKVYPRSPETKNEPEKSETE